MKITNIIFLAFICLILIQEGLTRDNSCYQVPYTYSTFALTWVGQYCSEKHCARNWENTWDGKSFTIHGYWPSSKNLAYLTCQRQDGYDRFCYSDYEFNLQKLTNLQSQMDKYWPQIGNIRQFWKYEWEKHGTCYLKLTLEKNNPHNLSADEIYYQFFEGALNKYKALSLSPSKSNFDSKEDLANQLNLSADQFIAICGNDNELDEIRICYDLGVPQTEKVISCPPNKPKQCSFPTRLNGYRDESL